MELSIIGTIFGQLLNFKQFALGETDIIYMHKLKKAKRMKERHLIG